MSITKSQLINLVSILAKETGRKYGLESGSAYTQWKLCDEKGSHIILRAKTKTELYSLIQAYRDVAWYVSVTK